MDDGQGVAKMWPKTNQSAKVMADVTGDCCGLDEGAGGPSLSGACFRCAKTQGETDRANEDVCSHETPFGKGDVQQIKVTKTLHLTKSRRVY